MPASSSAVPDLAAKRLLNQSASKGMVADAALSSALHTRFIGPVDYAACAQAMLAFTQSRDAATMDALWLCEHPPTFTQGVGGRAEHILNAGSIPVIATARGGQVTYHGPGQVVAYVMVDLTRRGYFVKEFVYRLETAALRTLEHFGITGHRVGGAPGIYVRLDDPAGHAMIAQRPMRREPGTAAPTPDFAGLGKIAALGIKLTRGCTWHGLALNVAMDLSPYERINPCGYAGLRSIDLSTMGVSTSWEATAQVLAWHLQRSLAP